ncbi:MAG: tetratricopeptide repeat protein [Bacteroidota bacterium]
MTGLILTPYKINALFIFLILFLRIAPSTTGTECVWDSAKVSDWDKVGSKELIRHYLAEQISCLRESNGSSTFQFLEELSSKASRSGELLLQVCTLEQLGQYYFLKKDYPSTLHNYLKEASLWEKQNNHFEKAHTLVKIADLYAKVGDFSKEYAYLQSAYRLYAEVGLKGPLGTIASRLGFYNKENARYDSAFFYLEQAKLFQQEVKDQDGLIYTINHLGRIYKDKGDFQTANDTYQLALDQAISLNNKHPECWTLINLGFLALDQDEYEKAKPHFVRAKSLADKESFQEILRLSCEGLYRLAEQEDDYKNAYYFFRQYQELGAHLRDNQLTSALAETEWRYQQSILQKELEIESLARNRDNLWKLLGMLASMMLLILLGFTWYFFRMKLKEAEEKKQALDLEVERYSEKNVLLQKRMVDIQNNGALVKWDSIEQLIHEQYPYFKTRLVKEHPKLSEQDLRFCMLLMTSFSTKEIADYLNISPASANKSRYRLRKKLGLSREENLLHYLAEQT